MRFKSTQILYSGVLIILVIISLFAFTNLYNVYEGDDGEFEHIVIIDKIIHKDDLYYIGENDNGNLRIFKSEAPMKLGREIQIPVYECKK